MLFLEIISCKGASCFNGGGGGGGCFSDGGGLHFYIVGAPQVASVLMGEGVWAPPTTIHNHCYFIPFQILPINGALHI